MAVMSATTPALIAAAAGVGFGHAILPDHWVPLAVVGRARRYPLRRVARLSGAAGIAHVLVSLVLGALIIGVGLQFRSAVAQAQDDIVGGVLLATGVAFVLVELRGRRRGHAHEHEHHQHVGGIASVLVPFGAAASPDLTILPVFLAAAAVGAATAVGSVLAFAAATIATIVVLTLLATVGGYQIKGHWLDRWANLVTAATLLVIGALVLAGVI
jgi:nickel/cobalt exporter